MHTEPRGATPITIVCVHTNEGGEGSKSAQGLYSYLQTIPGGYHKIVDNAECVTAAPDQTVVWGAGGINHRAVHVCLIGFANQTSEQWHDPYSSSEVKIAAAHVAIWCIKYNIPVVRLSPQQLLAGDRSGIVGHGDVSAVYPESQGHSDPGSAFPWSEFLALVAKAVSPPEKLTPMYVPPIDVVGGIAATCEDPTTHGMWAVGAKGHLYTLENGNTGKTPANYGAPYGQPYWGTRSAARIKAHNYGSALRKRWGYQIWATTGEGPYDFKPK